MMSIVDFILAGLAAIVITIVRTFVDVALTLGFFGFLGWGISWVRDWIKDRPNP